MQTPVRIQPGSVPPSRAPFRVFGEKRKIIEKEITKMIEMGKIQPTNSPYGAPVLFVPKPDGTLRFCVDYRALNKITIKDKHPLPHINDLLDAMEGATIFSTLDLTSGYYQVPIAEQDRHKTAFVTHMGQYEFRVMPMGVSNAPAEFQRRMVRALQPFIGKFVVVYIDDVLIFSRSMEEHLQHLQQVLEALKQHKWQLKRTKCEFGLSAIAFLGHIISAEGVRPNPKKLEVLHDWPIPDGFGDTPRAKSELRSFIGLANFFRKFAFRYTQTIKPLLRLLQEDVPWQWGPQEQTAW